jgi:molecular chaperone Hsp33
MQSALHPFQFENLPIRGRLLCLPNVTQHIHTLRKAPLPTQQLLGDLLAAAALLMHDTKRQASVNVQVQNVSRHAMAFAHCSTQGHLKAFSNEEMQGQAFAELGQEPDSHFAVTLDYGPETQPYQSLVPLIHPTAAKALEHYFTTSVQTPTLFRTLVWEHEGEVNVGAIFLQSMPGGLTPADAKENDDWNRLTLLLNTLKPEELANPSLPPEKLLTMLFAEDTLRLAPPEEFTMQADDPRPRMLAALATIPVEELKEMLADREFLTLTDQTSGQSQTFTRFDLLHLLEETPTQ